MCLRVQKNRPKNKKKKNSGSHAIFPATAPEASSARFPVTLPTFSPMKFPTSSSVKYSASSPAKLPVSILFPASTFTSLPMTFQATTMITDVSVHPKRDRRPKLPKTISAMPPPRRRVVFDSDEKSFSDNIFCILVFDPGGDK
ncbi:hypothetical protein RYX36_032208 [Vicia faba]